jgi:hypothetical protein
MGASNAQAGMALGSPAAEETDFDIEPHSVYLSPSGHRCRLAARPRSGVARFVYDLADGSPASAESGDGFFLARVNWRLLRRVA